jgi:hypothetical protein
MAEAKGPSKAEAMVDLELAELRKTFIFFTQFCLDNCDPDKTAHLDARVVMREVLKTLTQGETPDTITDTHPRDGITERVLSELTNEYPEDDLQERIEESDIYEYVSETKKATLDQLLKWGVEYYESSGVQSGRAMDDENVTAMLTALEKRFPEYRAPTMAEISARA